MKRYYYLCSDLDDISEVEQRLTGAGFSPVQFHTLSNDDAEVEKHHLNDVDSFSKKDIVISTLIGAGFGIAGAAMIIVLAMLLGVSGDFAWAPVLFLAICILGFCTWEGGLYGIQSNNREFARFESDLNSGKHVFFVDAEDDQQQKLTEIVGNYSSMRHSGSGSKNFSWLMPVRERARRFVHSVP